MFSKYISKVVSTIFGAYIEGLDNIHFPIWKGELELENLKINKKKFTSATSPVEVVLGTISKLSLKIPWRNLHTEPVTLTIDGVYVLLRRRKKSDIPRGQKAVDPDPEDSFSLRDVFNIQSEANEEEGDDKDSFSAKLVKKILENLHLRITNVHICYQDHESTPEHNFALGVTVDTITLATTNEQWIPLAKTSSAETESSWYKLLSFFNIAFYWDTDKGIGRDIKEDDNSSILAIGISHQNTPADHQYIVSPFSGLLRITVTGADELRCDAHLGLKELIFNLQTNQYRDLLNWLAFYSDWKRVVKYSRYRPDCTVLQNPAAWWKFAGDAVRAEVRKKLFELTWQRAEQKRGDRRAYVKLFRQKLAGQKILPTELQLLDALEKRLSYEDIVFFRAIAESGVEEQKEAGEAAVVEEVNKEEIVEEDPGDRPEGPWLLGQWATWPALRSWIWPEAPTVTSEGFALSAEEFREAAISTGLSKKLSKTSHASKYIPTIEFVCTVKKIQLTIADQLNGADHDLSVLLLNELDLKYLITHTGWKASGKLMDLSLHDSASKNTAFEWIIKAVSSSSEPVLVLQMEGLPKTEEDAMNDDDKNTNQDYLITAKLQPVEVVYSTPFLDSHAMFFTRADTNALYKIKQTILAKVHEIQEALYREVRRIIRNQKVLSVDLDFRLPIFTIPEKYNNQHSALLVIDSGELLIKSQPAKEVISSDDQPYNAVRKLSYKDQVMFLPASMPINPDSVHEDEESWPYAAYFATWKQFAVRVVPDARHPETRETIVAPVSFDVRAQVCSLPFDIDIPQIVLRGFVAPVSIDLSRRNAFQLARIAKATGMFEPGEDDSKDHPEREKAVPLTATAQKRSRADFTDLVTDTKDFIQTRKQTKEKLVKCALLEAFLNAPQITINLQYSLSNEQDQPPTSSLHAGLGEATELSIRASDLTMKGIVYVFQMDTDVVLRDLEIIDKSGPLVRRCEANNAEPNTNEPFLSLRVLNEDQLTINYENIDYIVDLRLRGTSVVIPEDLVLGLLDFYYQLLSASNLANLEDEDVDEDKDKKLKRSMNDRKVGFIDGEFALTDEIVDIKAKFSVITRYLCVTIQERGQTKLEDLVKVELIGFNFSGESRGNLVDLSLALEGCILSDRSVMGAQHSEVLRSLGPFVPDVEATEHDVNKYALDQAVVREKTLGPSRMHVDNLRSGREEQRELQNLRGQEQKTMMEKLRPAEQAEVDKMKPELEMAKMTQDEKSVNKWCNMKLTSFDATEPNWPGYHALLLLQVGPFRLVFLMQFLNLVRRLIQRIQTKSEEFATAAKIQPDQAKDDDPPTLMKVLIEIQNPDLEIPVSPVSTSSVVITCAKVNIHNTFIMKEEEHVIENKHTIHVSKLSAHSIEVQDGARKARTLMSHPVEVKVNLSAPIFTGPKSDLPKSHNLPQMDVTFQVKGLVLLMSRRQYNNIMLMIDHNITEQVVGAPKTEPASSKADRWVENKLKVVMESAVLHVFNDDESPNSFGFAALSIDDVSLETIFYSDLEIELYIFVRTLVLSSLLNGTSPRDIFRLGGDPFQLLHIVIPDDDVNTINLSARNPRAYIYIPTVMQLVNFFVPEDDPDARKRQMGIMPTFRPINTLSINLQGVKLLLMSDILAEFDKNSVVVLTDVTVRWMASDENCQKLDMKIEGLRAGIRGVFGPALVMDLLDVVKNPSKEASDSLGEQVLERLNGQFSMNIVPAAHGLNIGFVQLDPISLKLRSKTIFSFSRIATSLQSAAASVPSPSSTRSENAKKLDESPSGSRESIVVHPDELAYVKSDKRADSKDVMQVSSVQTLQNLDTAEPTAPSYQFVLSSDGLRVVISDDQSSGSSTTPLIMVKASSIAGKLNFTDSLSVRLDANLEASYFNTHHAIWEPFIEPWQLRVLGQNTSYAALEILSTDLLNVNISPVFIDKITKSIKPWSENLDEVAKITSGDGETSPSGSVTKSVLARSYTNLSVYSPFWVRNLSGTLLRSQLVKTGGIVLSGEPGDDVHPGDFLPVSVKSTIFLDAEEDLMQNLTLAIELVGFNHSINIPLDRIQEVEYRVPLASAVQDKPLDTHGVAQEVTIVCRLRVIDSKKVIEVLSPLVLENYAGTTFQMGLELSPAANHPGAKLASIPVVQLADIQPGQSASPVPLSVVSNTRLHLRPAFGSYEWSKAVIDIQNVQDEIDFECHLQEQPTHVYYFRVILHKRTPYTVIKIVPIMELFNLLPLSIQYILDERDSFIKGIEGESSAIVSHVCTGPKFKVSVKVPGYSHSKALALDVTQDQEASNLKILEVSKSKKGPPPLNLNVRFSVSKGCRRLVIFSQYWVYNRIGCNMSIVRKEGLHRPGSPIICGPEVDVPLLSWFSSVSTASMHPVLLSFIHPESNHNRITIRLNNHHTEHSKAFAVSAIGDQSVVKLEAKHEEPKVTHLYHIGATVELAPNNHTKIVTFWPRYVLVNEDKELSITVGQPGTSNKLTIPPGSRVPFLYWVKESPHMLRARFSDASPWSTAFKIKDVSNSVLKFTEPSAESWPAYIGVQVMNNRATNFVVFSPREKPPFRIDNRTDLPFVVSQKGFKDHLIAIPPKTEVDYAWDHPLDAHELEIASEHTDFDKAYKLDKIKPFPVKDIKSPNGERLLSLAAKLVEEDGVRILRLETMASQSNALSEVLAQNFRIKLAGVGISLVNSTPQELLYFSMDDIVVNYSSSNLFMKAEVKVGDVQIDNMITTNLHPVLLRSITHNEPGQEPKPAIHLSVIKSNTITNLMYFHYLSLLVQELDIRLEESFIYDMIDYLKSLGLKVPIGPSQDEVPDFSVIPRCDQAGELVSLKNDSPRAYLELLMLYPLKLKLSFNLSQQTSQHHVNNRLVSFLHDVGIVAVSFHNASINLNALTLRHAYGSIDELMQILQKHYTQQAIRQVYKILGTIDFIGSPANLFKSIGTGFLDFFVEPSKGIVRSPEEFTNGLAKGSSSLLKHTVYGIFTSASRITGSTARGLAALTRDKAYQHDRDIAMKPRPSNVPDGISHGANSLQTGISHGLTGLVETPAEKIHEDGIPKGVAVGIPKGVAGLVMEPLTGVIDLVHQTSEGGRNISRPTDRPTRKRDPRYIPTDGSLVVYQPVRAPRRVPSGNFGNLNK